MVKYPDSLAPKSPPPKSRRLWRFIRFMSSFSIALLVTVLVILMLWPYMVITVPSGYVGVLWKRLNGIDPYCWCFVGRGTVLDPKQLREEGLHIIAPWDKLFLYDLRLQSLTLPVYAISKDGVSVTAQINVRFQLVHQSVAVLHKFIGPNYRTSVVATEIGSLAQEVISKYTAEEVYTNRQKIQDEIRESAQRRLAAHLNMLVQPEAMEQPDPHHYRDYLQNSIQFLDTLILNIELPPAIVAAINRQTEQFYQIQEYKFRVQREAEESKRKQIEANGIAAFQRTVSKGISDSYLRWRGIEATLALAKSPNAKIVIIGGGKDGLPIILGNVDTPAASSVVSQPRPNGATPSSETPSSASSEEAPPPPSSNARPENRAGEGAPPAGSPPGSPNERAPAAPDNKANNHSSANPENSNKQAGSSSSLSLSNIRAVLSRLYGSSQPSAATPGTGSQANQ
jgi:regulator of protease activity HflC (stomatin/prohibitin superfamily)